MQCQIFPHDIIIVQAILIAESPRMAYAGAQSLYASFEGKILFKEVHNATINAAYDDAKIFGKRNVRKRGHLNRPDRITLNSVEVDSIVNWFSESNEEERIVELGRILSMFETETICEIYAKIAHLISDDVEHSTKCD